MYYDRYWRRRPYVPVAKRRANAARRARESADSGIQLQPVETAGRRIASSFWGKAWCDNLECYSDYGNRLPRGRTYVRNGSVIDLKIASGGVEALVSGSRVYTVSVKIAPMSAVRWQALVAECSGRVGSLVDLLQGRFSSGVMQVLARREQGLFPSPKEIVFSCSCPDGAAMCKHVAAVLYGIGARFDAEPGLFFTLRQVDSEDLIAAAAGAEGLAGAATDSGHTIADADLGGIFGIDLEPETSSPARERRRSHSAPLGHAAPGSPAVATKSPPARRPRRARSPDDGFAAVFGPGLEVTTQLLQGFGVPRTTFTNWLTSGVLVRTTTRGVYRTTAATLDRVRRAYARSCRQK